MSHNLELTGYIIPWQTPTYITRTILSKARGNSPLEFDLDVLRLLSEYIKTSYYPEPLVGKDSRNPFLIKRRNEEIEKIENMLNNIKQFIIENSKGEKLFGSN